MEYKEFKKFSRLIRKHPIPGFTFDWYTAKNSQSPLTIPKLRKDGTYMPEKCLRDLKMHHGVWIDIFIYFEKPCSPFAIHLQENLLGSFQVFSSKYFYRSKKSKGRDYITDSKFNRFVGICPDFLLYYARFLCLQFAEILGSPKSAKLRLFDYFKPKFACVDRKNYEKKIKHVFEDREFLIPKEYDAQLTFHYGDYMTPVKSHIHVNLEKIELRNR